MSRKILKIIILILSKLKGNSKMEHIIKLYESSLNDLKSGRKKESID